MRKKISNIRLQGGEDESSTLRLVSTILKHFIMWVGLCNYSNDLKTTNKLHNLRMNKKFIIEFDLMVGTIITEVSPSKYDAFRSFLELECLVECSWLRAIFECVVL